MDMETAKWLHNMESSALPGTHAYTYKPTTL